MIYHIAHKQNWNDSLESGEYISDSLGNEGFIHCSTLEKLEESANNFFKGQTNLLILIIDENKLTSDLVWEDLYNTNFDFPHIYGKLNVDAVLKLIDLDADEKGTFRLPQEMSIILNKS